MHWLPHRKPLQVAIGEPPGFTTIRLPNENVRTRLAA